MASISRLEESTYKRIAAGEVIVNPAAAVKELVENALDAGATAVTIEIVEGGRDLIRVTDNGHGMDREDLAICIEKHATSKISTFDEVYALSSLGFRGEALASIAEVARLTISSRERGTETGAELTVAGGGEPAIVEAGLPEGTTVRVDDLFFNVPARRKFLKSAAREAAQVSDTVKRLLLSRPDVAFKYIRNHHVVYQTPGASSLRKVAAIIYGSETLQQMIDVSYQGSHAQVSGLISQPTYVFKSAQRQEFFLNGRYIQSKALQKAVMQGYQGSILHGHHPAFILSIETDPATVDINIHPAKLSALLFQEEDVMRDVAAAVTAGALKEIRPPQVVPAPPADDADRPHRQQNFWTTVPRRSTLMETDKNAAKDDSPARLPSGDVAAPAPDRPEEDAYAAPDFALPPEPATGHQSPPAEDLRKLTEYRVVGTVFSTYILCETADAVYVIDQHAAQERLTYDRILNWVKQGEKYGQLLLFPVVKKFSAADHDLLLEHRELLDSLGIAFEPFGETSLRFVSFPVQVASTDADLFLDSMLEELRTYGDDAVVARDRIITQACRHSVKAGTDLNEQEIARIVAELTGTDSIPHCPHGRPVAVALTKSDLEKGFKRRV